jgi:hypothetical protein
MNAMQKRAGGTGVGAVTAGDTDTPPHPYVERLGAAINPARTLPHEILPSLL